MALFVCKNCGFGSASWMGRCPECQTWSSFVERPDLDQSNKKNKNQPTKKITLTPLGQVQSISRDRKTTGIFEFDRVLGNGFLKGEVILLTGEPGIGKSTLLLQSLQHLKTVYISGEEAAEQIKDRADRLKVNLANFLFSNDLQVEGIIEGISELKNIDVIVIDSIQTIYSNSVESVQGGVSQIKETGSQLINFAKQSKIPIIIIGHVNKGGDIAGPKTLEHMVDCVLVFEGEKVSHYRVLRATKNRFGSTDEIGIFEMKQHGLEEVNNPLVFINQPTEKINGKAVAGVMEGKRPLFFEIQTLAVPSALPYPKRVVNGVDYNKVLLLLAVIRKHLGLNLDKFDIYVNVVGGVEIKSTDADLAIIASIISSVKNTIIPQSCMFTGEVGLLGEVRLTSIQEKIINDAVRLKFKKVYSGKNLKNIRDLRQLTFAV